MPPVVLLAPLIWAMHVGFCFAIGREKTHRSAGRGSHVCVSYIPYIIAMRKTEKAETSMRCLVPAPVADNRIPGFNTDLLSQTRVCSLANLKPIGFLYL